MTETSEIISIRLDQRIFSHIAEAAGRVGMTPSCWLEDMIVGAYGSAAPSQREFRRRTHRGRRSAAKAAALAARHQHQPEQNNES